MRTATSHAIVILRQGGLLRRSVVQQQVKDLSRQVAVLLGEVQRLKTGRIGTRVPRADAGAVMNAQSVITAHLVDFKDIQVRARWFGCIVFCLRVLHGRKLLLFIVSSPRKVIGSLSGALY